MGGFVYPTANVERTPIIGFLPSPDRRAVPSHGSTIPTDKDVVVDTHSIFQGS